MTSLADRPNTAVLVIDVQNDVVANAYQRDEVIANIGTVVERARAEKVIAHTNTYWSYQTAPQRDASVVPTAELTTFAAAPPDR